MVQSMVQDDADNPRRSSPRNAASSLVGSRSEVVAFSLIMPGSRVRVPPLLFCKLLDFIELVDVRLAEMVGRFRC